MKNRWIVAVVVLLIVFVGVFAFLNRGNLEEKKTLESTESFKIVAGEKEALVSMSDLERLGIEAFKVIMDTSDTDPEEVDMKGTELKKILEDKEISLSGGETLEVRALDGYASALSYEEVMQDENIYMVVEMEGEPLGTKADGGRGPYMMVIRSAKFAQRWCKFVEEVVIQ